MEPLVDNTNKSILPSKKFLTILGSFVILTLVVFSVSYLIRNRKISTSNLPANVKSVDYSFSDIYSKDSDGDGLPDWQENILGTDKNKRDTDDNGVNDKEQLKSEALPTGANENTATDEFSREFFAAAMALKGSGGFNDANIKTLIETSTKTLSEKTSDKKYTLENLKIKDTTNYSVITTSYLQKVSPVFKTISTEKYSYLDDIASAYENDNESTLAKLDPVIKKYSDIEKTLATVEVPQKLALAHLDVLNTIAQLNTSLVSIRNGFTDPLTAFLAISKYPDGINELSVHLKTYGQLLTNYMKK